MLGFLFEVCETTFARALAARRVAGTMSSGLGKGIGIPIKLIKGSFDFVKVLGNGEVSKALTLEGLKVSTSAREKIEKAGGSIADSAPAKS